MNAHQLAVVRESFERLRPLPKSFGQGLYERLFALDPSLRPLFRGNAENQAAMLAAAITMSVSALCDEEYVPLSVKEVGARHAGYGLPEGSYETFGRALLETLRASSGEGFTREVEDAWAAAYDALASAMKQAAEEARRREAEAATVVALGPDDGSKI